MILSVYRMTALVAGVILAGSLTRGQSPSQADAYQQGEMLIRVAIEARGGQRYLGFKTLVASGQYTPFDGGVSTVPMPFLDTIVFPDKERTEFGRGKKKDRRIQVNVGRTGWVYDGETETLKDQNEQQISDFQEGLETDIDHLLRGGWQAPGVRVRFSGREETRPGERADVIEIQLTPERKVFLSLDRSTHLPLAVVSERAAEQGLVRNETRFFQYIVYDGVKFPNIVDFFRNGVQLSRINFQDIKLDGPVPDATFAKPANAKAVK